MSNHIFFFTGLLYPSQGKSNPHLIYYVTKRELKLAVCFFNFFFFLMGERKIQKLSAKQATFTPTDSCLFSIEDGSTFTTHSFTTLEINGILCRIEDDFNTATNLKNLISGAFFSF